MTFSFTVNALHFVSAFPSRSECIPTQWSHLHLAVARYIGYRWISYVSSRNQGHVDVSMLYLLLMLISFGHCRLPAIKARRSVLLSDILMFNSLLASAGWSGNDAIRCLSSATHFRYLCPSSSAESSSQFVELPSLPDLLPLTFVGQVSKTAI